MNLVYALMDPRCPDVIRYVGVTKQKLAQRLIGHVKAAREGACWPVSNWTRKLLASGVRPVGVVLECTEDRKRENFWVLHYLREGAPLLNCAEARGDEVVCTEETRKKISAFHLGRKRSPETRARQSASLKGKPPTNFARGFHHSEETKAKIAAALLGRTVPAEVRAKTAAGLRGKKKSPEHVAKVAAKRRGCKHSDEAKAKMSAKALLRWAKPPTEQVSHEVSGGKELP